MNNQIIQNLKLVFSNFKYTILAIITAFVFFSITIYFSNIAVTIGNLGLNYFIIQTIIQILTGILFSIFIPVTIYKIILFSDFSTKENTSGALGGFIAVIVAGCPACSITLASYIGVSGIFTTLPFYGLELKVLTLPLMGWANYSLLKNLTACQIKPTINKKKV